MKKIILSLLICLCSAPAITAQEYYIFSGDRLILDNGHIKRVISTAGNTISCSEIYLAGSKENYAGKSREFSFSAGDRIVDGLSPWKVLSVKSISDDVKGRGASLSLQLIGNPDLHVELLYMMYPGLPLIRKWIKLTNTGQTDLRIEDLNIEDLQTRIGYVTSYVYHNYGRMKSIGMFEGNWDDPVVVLHDMDKKMGIAVGNEAPGALKRTAYHTKVNNLEAGLTHSDQGIPFRKWLRPGETWETPKVFICLYNNTDDGFRVVNDEVNAFVIRHMNTRIVTKKEKPVFVYNTWYPFRTFVNDSLVRDVAKAAAECGIQEFIIDDGWQVNDKAKTSDKEWGRNYGDWLIDEKKFPGGLKPTFDYIRSLGMKPGLWISIGSATPDALVFRQHPEWFVKSPENKPGNLHQGSSNPNFVTSCMGTEWTEYIKQKILTLVREHGLAYAKLDFAVATSAYVNNDSITGCYSTDHPYHKDHNESYIVIFERLFKLFDELHEAAPDLFIDCTFETAGKLQLMDYAIAQHAEGNWLSNIEQPFPTGPLRARHLAWWRSPAVPASSLVIGNLPMNEETFEFSLKSLIGSLPIVLGDPRALTLSQRAKVKSWSIWMQQMQKKHDYMSYRKDLPGFGEPAEGMWDGWMRLNTDTGSGGIVGVFRQGAAEGKRIIVLKDLDPVEKYAVRLAPEGKEIIKTTGKVLMEKGFEVVISKRYDGNIYEIAKE